MADRVRLEFLSRRLHDMFHHDWTRRVTSSALLLQCLDVGDAFFDRGRCDEPFHDVIHGRQLLRVERAGLAVTHELASRN